MRGILRAIAVDMEAAAVARAAEAHGKAFAAVKAISDESDFELPPMEKFIRPDGSFAELRFGLNAAVQPWMWAKVYRSARNSNLASRALCVALRAIVSARNSEVHTTANHLKTMQSQCGNFIATWGTCGKFRCLVHL